MNPHTFVFSRRIFFEEKCSTLTVTFFFRLTLIGPLFRETSEITEAKSGPCKHSIFFQNVLCFLSVKYSADVRRSPLVKSFKEGSLLYLTENSNQWSRKQLGHSCAKTFYLSFFLPERALYINFIIPS